MTYINLASNASVSNVKSTFSIFSLMIRNIRSNLIGSTNNSDFGLYHDSLHLIYSNNNNVSNCPSFKYKPYISNSVETNYTTFNRTNAGGLFAPIAATTNSQIITAVNDATNNFRFFNPGTTTSIAPHYSYLRFYTGSSTNNSLYSIGQNNPYRPDINTCIIPKIRLKGGFEYFIEIINNTNRIKFSTEATGLQQISLKKEASPDVDSDMSKIYINNDSYNPHLYASYVNKNANQYDIFSLTYKFDDYNPLGSQWASRFIIHQIPIV